MQQPFIAVSASTDPDDMRGEWYPSWFDGVIEARRVGMACTMIRQSLFIQLGYPWFVWPEDKNLGEDTEFCLRVNHKGFGPIMARGDLRCGHYKTVDMAFMVDFKTQRVVEKEVEYAR